MTTTNHHPAHRSAARLTMLLLLTLLLGSLLLTACGDGGSNTVGSSGPYYQAAYQQIEMPDARSSADYLIKSGDNFFFTTYVYDDPVEYTGGRQVLMKLNADGSTEQLELPAAREIPEGYNGGSYIQSTVSDAAGNLYLLFYSYSYTYLTPGGAKTLDWSDDLAYEEGDTYYDLYKFSPEGELLMQFDLNPLRDAALESTEEDPEYFYFNVNYLGVDENGNIAVAADQNIFLMDSLGAFYGTVTVDNWVNSLNNLPDGRVVAGYYGDEGIELGAVDFSGKKLEKLGDAPDNAWNFYTGNSKYPLLYTNGSYLYGYNYASGANDVLFSFINIDLDPNNISVIVANGDGTYSALLNEWDSSYDSCTPYLVTVSEVKSDPNKDKTILTLATQYLDYNLQSEVIKFNRSSADYHVNVIDYSQYNTEDDYSAGLTKLTTEISSGKLPDILDLNGFDVRTLAARGLLVDLLPLMENDADYKASDLLPNVLEAVGVDGCLYNSISCFTVNTVFGPTALVGSEPGWTYQEFMDALAKMPQGATAFDEYTTKDSMLTQTLYNELDHFINWSDSTCDFANEDFVGLLEFVNTFPSDYDWDNYDYGDYESPAQRIAAGKQMLIQAYIYEFYTVNEYNRYFSGSGATAIGFPSSEGVGSYLSADGSQLAITSGCKNPDAAWQIVRLGFSADNGYGFPVFRSKYNELRTEAMTTDYVYDENGNVLKNPDGSPKQQPKYTMWDEQNGEINIYALSEEEAAAVDAIVLGTTKSTSYQEEIYLIVSEEAAAFFSGSKSAAAVADLIQSRVAIYLSEQK